ncbi:hypothetical protein KW782_00660 [Candidatus Parcubacteria bacterium]|nr:hypothetical protein [Candidatus Parcubacteria bacterium]
MSEPTAQIVEPGIVKIDPPPMFAGKLRADYRKRDSESCRRIPHITPLRLSMGRSRKPNF